MSAKENESVGASACVNIIYRLISVKRMLFVCH